VDWKYHTFKSDLSNFHIQSKKPDKGERNALRRWRATSSLAWSSYGNFGYPVEIRWNLRDYQRIRIYIWVQILLWKSNLQNKSMRNPCIKRVRSSVLKNKKWERVEIQLSMNNYSPISWDQNTSKQITTVNAYSMCLRMTF